MRSTEEVIKEFEERGKGWDASHDEMVYQVSLAVLEIFGNLERKLTRLNNTLQEIKGRIGML